MENSKNKELISKLYLLKALLAKIVSNNEEIEKNEKDIENCNKEFNVKKELNPSKPTSKDLMEVLYDRGKLEKSVEEKRKSIEVFNKKVDDLKFQIKHGKNAKQTTIYLIKNILLPLIVPALLVGLIITFDQSIKTIIPWIISIASICSYIIWICNVLPPFMHKWYYYWPIVLPVSLMVSLIFLSNRAIFITLCMFFVGSIIGYVHWLMYEMPFESAKTYLLSPQGVKNNQDAIAIYEQKTNCLKLELPEEEALLSEKILQEKVLREKRDQEYKNIIQEYQNHIKHERDITIQNIKAQIKTLVEDNQDMHTCAENSIPLDERDWKNLDLIIYELETGRADTIKEALQQADLYVRHGEIIKVMENATTAICSSIRDNIGRLSSSINFALSEIRYDLADINQSNREMSAKLDTMIDSQELSNALLKKADVSSEKLAESVSRIRQLKDYEHFGIR